VKISWTKERYLKISCDTLNYIGTKKKKTIEKIIKIKKKVITRIIRNL